MSVLFLAILLQQGRYIDGCVVYKLIGSCFISGTVVLVVGGDGLFYSPKNFSVNPEVLPSVIEFNCYYMKTQGLETPYTYSWDLNGKFYERTDNFTRQVEVYNPSVEGDYTCNALTGGQKQDEITVTLRLPG